MQRLTTLLLGLVLVGCDRLPWTHPRATHAEIQVVAVALADFAGEPDSGEVLRVYRRLVPRTAEFPDSAAWMTAMDGFGLDRTRYPTLVASYWRANRHARWLSKALRVTGWRVQLTDTPTEYSPQAETIHHVSRVGFAANGDSALVAVDALCGLLCGRGVLVVYVRSQEGWRLASTLQRRFY